ncbi:MAG TPA: aldose epimerase [Opitutaceae bacterium]
MSAARHLRLSRAAVAAMLVCTGAALGAGEPNLPDGAVAVSRDGGRIVSWTVGRSHFSAAPERGARLLSWDVRRADGTVRPVIYGVRETEAADLARARGGIPVLFPFAGASTSDGRPHTWRAEDGVVRPMPMHGFARQGRFSVEAIASDGFTARFAPDETAEAAYPFRYRFTVVYRFFEYAMRCELRLANDGTVPLPWAAGLHPYFAVPWSAGASRDDYVIAVPATRSWRRAGHGLVAGPAPVFPRALVDPALRLTFWSGLSGSEVSFGPVGSDERIELVLGGEDGPPPESSIVLWTESDAAPFFCVEPFMAPANAPETGVGLQCVPPGGTGSFIVEIRVQ